MITRTTQLISTLAAAVLCASAATAGQVKTTAHSSAQVGKQSNTSESSRSSSISEGDLSVTITKRVKTTTDTEGNTTTDEKSETKATLAGKAVPSDRIRTNGNLIEILDEKGAVIRSIQAPDMNEIQIISGSDAGGQLRVFGRSGAHSGASAGSSAKSGGKSSSKSSGSSTPAPSVTVAGSDISAPKVMLGVTMEEPDESIAEQLKVQPAEATLIMSVTPDLPAAKAGLKKHDVIISIDGEKPATPERIRSVLQSKDPGNSVKLGVISGGDTKDVVVTLEAWDAERLGIPGGSTMTYTLSPHSVQGTPLDADMRKQIEQMMKEFEGRFQDGTIDIDDPNGMLQQFFAPAPGGKGHSFTFRVPGAATSVAPAAPADAPAATDDRIRQLEERIEKLNETILRLERMLHESHDTGSATKK